VEDPHPVHGRQDRDRLPEDVASLRFRQGTSPRDVVEQVLARRWTFHDDEKAVLLFEVVDEVDHAVDVGKSL